MRSQEGIDALPPHLDRAPVDAPGPRRVRLKRIAAGSAAGALVGLALGAWLWSLDAAVVAAAGLTASIVVWLLWAGFEIVSASDDEPAGEFASPAHDADGPPEFVDTDAIWYTP